jgi:hypothetical protein
MRIAIMQPYVFPYIGYFQLINVVDKFILFDDVNFINRSWINRNNILVNGEPYLFTIPLHNASQNQLINETEIAEVSGWKNKFFKTLKQAYKKAPYFNEVFALADQILQSQMLYIHELAFLGLTKICGYLGIETEFFESSSLSGSKDLKAQERIIDICLEMKADQYINPIGGTKLYSKDDFASKGISLNFLKVTAYSYPQFSNKFVPDLSIIDVLMFNSVDETRELLNKYRLI